jgi:hypothetical protein
MPDLLEADDFPFTVTNAGGLGNAFEIQFQMKDNHSAAPLNNVLGPCAGREVNPVTVRLPSVRDDKPSYVFAYKVLLDGLSIFDSEDHTVWPRRIRVTARYRKLPEDRMNYVDGATVSGFPFVLMQGDELLGDDFNTAADGTRVYDATTPGQITLRPESPWVVEAPDVAGQAAMGREREFFVRKVCDWRAKIRSHVGGREEDKPFRQWVNLADAANPATGSLVKIEVGPEDLDDALKDQEIFVRVTFPRSNSKRNDPRPAVWRTDQADTSMATMAHPQPGAGKCVYEFDYTLPADAAAAVFYVQMGLAGGDKCTIEVGVTEAREDDVLHIRNWRRLSVEMLVPQANLRAAAPDLLDDATAALAPALREELAKIFSDSFIEFVYPQASSKSLAVLDFTKYWRGTGAAIDRDADYGRAQSLFVPRNKICIVKENQLKEALPANANATVSLCSIYQILSLRSVHLGPVSAPNAMTWGIVDFFVYRSVKNVVGRPVDDHSMPADVTNLSITRNFYATTLTGVAESQEVTLPFHVFDYDPVDPVLAAGNFGVHSVKWRAVTYTREGTANAMKITEDGHPCGEHRQWSNPIVFATLQERDKWIEVINSRTVKFKLPADTDDAPGNQLRVVRIEADASSPTQARLASYTIGIEVYLEFLGVDIILTAGATGPSLLAFTFGGTLPTRYIAEILAHEIGHICGQTYVADAGEGWRNAQIPGIPFGEKFPAGQYYVEHGHVGPHCAKGLVDSMEFAGAGAAVKQRVAGRSFSTPHDEDKAFFQIDHDSHCLMWGSGRRSDKNRNFCEQCKRHIRAVELTDIRTKVW